MRHLRLIGITATDYRLTDAATGEAIDGPWTCDCPNRTEPACAFLGTLTTGSGSEPAVIDELHPSPEEIELLRALMQSALDNPETPDDVRERLREQQERR